jgi:UDPglucose 6-dehydrogenase
MKITIIGTGYVGLVTGTGFANLGNDVLCLDKDKKKVADLKKGILPLHEPGLQELFSHNIKEGRLAFTDDEKAAVRHAEIIFITVGTPPKDDGEADLTYVKQAAIAIGRHIESYKVIVNKSTVPLGTADLVKDIIKNENKSAKFDVVSNPEFLREGAAVKDFETPDRIVIGVESAKARGLMEKLYSSIVRVGKPIMFTDKRSAELIKYASNAMLSTRISFMNQLSHLCEKSGADVKEVAKGMGLDSRIGPRFLQAGVGYGGSCFPKDVIALSHMLKVNGCESDLFDAVHNINELQKIFVVRKLSEIMKLKGKTIAVWGLSFKPKTDDIRNSPAIDIIQALQEAGCTVQVFDPVATENAKKVLKKVKCHETPYDAVKGASALILVTEWNEFRSLDMAKVAKLMKNPVLIDGRNIYVPEEMTKAGFRYMGIGR